MERDKLLDLIYERCSHFIAQDRHITMKEFIQYVLAQVEREQVKKAKED